MVALDGFSPEAVAVLQGDGVTSLEQLYEYDIVDIEKISGMTLDLAKEIRVKLTGSEHPYNLPGSWIDRRNG